MRGRGLMSNRDQPSEGLTFTLPVRATGDEAEALRTALLEVRDSGSVFSVDAGAVSFVDTRVLQLLVAATADIGARGGSVFIDQPSPAFIRAVEILGLRKHINLGRNT